MQQETEDLIAQASEFIEENEELLEDPEVSIYVLQAILLQGAPMGTQLVEEYERLSHIVKSEAGKLADAIRSKELPPKQIAALAFAYGRSEAEAEVANNVLTRFSAFMEKAQALYEREQGDEQAVAEEMEIPAAVFGNEESRAAAQQLAEETARRLRQSGIEIERDMSKPPWYKRLFS